jgi:hypothetical protein
MNPYKCHGHLVRADQFFNLWEASPTPMALRFGTSLDFERVIGDRVASHRKPSGPGRLVSRRSALCRGAVVGAALCLAIVPGCSEPPTAGRVTGAVTLDGQPLPAGQVRFVALDGSSPTAGAAIVDGRFVAELPPGELRVEISAPKPGGRQQQMYDGHLGAAVESPDELLPARYNTSSKLTLMVGPGEQQAEFKLKSAP